ncbi:MAG TPA: glycosyl hydrolase [Bryobacteraceae bacterium]|nr:glycosyl hydrolase [Bryobacteraceae bacterium]
MVRYSVSRAYTAVLFLLFAWGPIASAQVDPKLYQTLRWRSIGPDRGGRVTTVAGVPNDRLVYYMGATGGGVWKTVNAGVTWTPTSDRYFKTGSVGSIAVAVSDPNTIYVGMGEACLRANISHGDGVYKTTDGGRTWRNVGLRDTSQIGKVYVDPTDANLVYVAAIGHPYGPNQERGVFRSKDGGQTWAKILFVDDKTGAADIVADPANPRTMYASTWQVLRTPWDIYEFGPGSGIYKTTDGGDNWTLLKNGLPKSPMGKIGIAVSPVDSNRVWATIGGDDGGIYLSDDAGQDWKLINGSFEMHSRQYYYGHIFADPKERDTVYTFVAKDFYKSTTAGKTWTTIQTPHGDYHDLWIDPKDNQRMVNANDGGATITFDGGKSWTSEMNQPTGQFYTVRADNDFPYHVYGAQQDDTTVSISSQAIGGATGRGNLGGSPDFTEVGGGESGYVVPDLKNPDIVYAGAYWGLLTRYDKRTAITRNISVWPDMPGGRSGADTKYRFQWTFPIAVSPADPSAIYVGGNVVFKSVNQGQTWKSISPDLTRNDKTREAGGRLEDIYDTVFTIAPSPLDKNVIWAGSDDGLVHITRNGGDTWSDVTPPGVQPWTRMNVIEASPHDPATAYVAANRYQLDDFRPYIYRTRDYGKTWTLVVQGIPENTFVRSVRQDPVRSQLLYAGTETGVYVSFDDGEHWQSLQQNLPVVPITDLTIKDGDLIVSTQGRSFWVMDDISPLEQLSGDMNAALHLFRPRPAYRAGRGRSFGGSGTLDRVLVDYELASAPAQPVTIEFLDASGKLIKSFSSEQKDAPAQGRGRRGAGGRGGNEAAVRAEEGLNRFAWDMRYPDATGIEGGTFLLGGNLRGPEAAPGTYQVRITTGAVTATQKFEIRKDPRVPTTDLDYRKQLTFLLNVRDRLSETDDAVNRIQKARRQVNSILQKAGAQTSLVDEGGKLNAALKAEAEQLFQPNFTGFDDQTLIYPLGLNNRFAALEIYGQGNYAPTDQEIAVLHELSADLERLLAKMKQTLEVDLPAFTKDSEAAGVAEVIHN